MQKANIYSVDPSFS